MGYYTSNFMLSHVYHVDLDYLDNLMPFERELYITMLIERVEKENAARSH